jgi:hypothetical protein
VRGEANRRSSCVSTDELERDLCALKLIATGSGLFEDEYKLDEAVIFGFDRAE